MSNPYSSTVNSGWLLVTLESENWVKSSSRHPLNKSTRRSDVSDAGFAMILVHIRLYNLNEYFITAY